MPTMSQYQPACGASRRNFRPQYRSQSAAPFNGARRGYCPIPTSTRWPLISAPSAASIFPPMETTSPCTTAFGPSFTSPKMATTASPTSPCASALPAIATTASPTLPRAKASPPIATTASPTSASAVASPPMATTASWTLPLDFAEPPMATTVSAGSLVREVALAQNEMTGPILCLMETFVRTDCESSLVSADSAVASTCSVVLVIAASRSLVWARNRAVGALRDSATIAMTYHFWSDDFMLEFISSGTEGQPHAGRAEAEAQGAGRKKQGE